MQFPEFSQAKMTSERIISNPSIAIYNIKIQHKLGDQTDKVQISAFLLTNQLTLGKFLKFSVPQFPVCEIGRMIIVSIIEGCSEDSVIQYMCRAYSKHQQASVDISSYQVGWATVTEWIKRPLMDHFLILPFPKGYYLECLILKYLKF